MDAKRPCEVPGTPIPDRERDHRRPEGCHPPRRTGWKPEGALGPSAEFWVNLETSYQLYKEGRADPAITAEPGSMTKRQTAAAHRRAAKQSATRSPSNYLRVSGRDPIEAPCLSWRRRCRDRRAIGAAAA